MVVRLCSTLGMGGGEETWQNNTAISCSVRFDTASVTTPGVISVPVNFILVSQFSRPLALKSSAQYNSHSFLISLGIIILSV